MWGYEPPVECEAPEGYVCEACNGAGWLRGEWCAPKVACGCCGGTGVVTDEEEELLCAA